MLNKSHRSVVSTCVLIFMPYFEKKLKKKHLFFFQKKHDPKKTVFFFASLVTESFVVVYDVR